jgi:hypothetical protein
MRLERHAGVGNLTQPGERHHLEAAGVREDWTVPTNEPMQAAKSRYALGCGAQHQVIGVAEDDIGASIAHLVKKHSLDRAGGAHRHEGGSADFTTRGVNASKACVAAGLEQSKRKAGCHRAAGNSREASP